MSGCDDVQGTMGSVLQSSEHGMELQGAVGQSIEVQQLAIDLGL